MTSCFAFSSLLSLMVYQKIYLALKYRLHLFQFCTLSKLLSILNSTCCAQILPFSLLRLLLILLMESLDLFYFLQIILLPFIDFIVVRTERKSLKPCRSIAFA